MIVPFARLSGADAGLLLGLSVRFRSALHECLKASAPPCRKGNLNRDERTVAVAGEIEVKLVGRGRSPYQSKRCTDRRPRAFRAWPYARTGLGTKPTADTVALVQKNRPGDPRLTGRPALGQFAVTSVLVLAAWPMVITALQSALDGLLG